MWVSVCVRAGDGRGGSVLHHEHLCTYVSEYVCVFELMCPWVFTFVYVHLCVLFEKEKGWRLKEKEMKLRVYVSNEK